MYPPEDDSNEQQRRDEKREMDGKYRIIYWNRTNERNDAGVRGYEEQHTSDDIADPDVRASLADWLHGQKQLFERGDEADHRRAEGGPRDAERDDQVLRTRHYGLRTECHVKRGEYEHAEFVVAAVARLEALAQRDIRPLLAAVGSGVRVVTVFERLLDGEVSRPPISFEGVDGTESGHERERQEYAIEL